MKLSVPALSLALLSLPVLAANEMEQNALKFVPGGTIHSVENDEVKVKTKSGAMIEIELNRDGSLDEASGSFAQNDIFVPGNGLLTLTDAVAAIKKEGKNVSGEWSLDKDLLRDWEYEFEGMEDGKQFEYTLNAKNGKLVKTEAD